MLNILLKPYINYKIRNIINAELRSTIEKDYKNPYLYDSKWMTIAWTVHHVVNAYKEKFIEAYEIINNMNLTDEQREEAYKQIKLVPKYDSNGQLSLDIKFTANN